MISTILFFFQADMTTTYEIVLKLAGGGIGAGTLLFGLSKAINSATKFAQSIRGPGTNNGEVKVSFSDDFMDKFVVKMNEAQRPLVDGIQATLKGIGSAKRVFVKNTDRIEGKLDLAMLRQTKIYGKFNGKKKKKG